MGAQARVTTVTAPTITNVCDMCQGKQHQPLEVLRFNARQKTWLCGYCRAAPKDRPVDLDAKPAHKLAHHSGCNCKRCNQGRAVTPKAKPAKRAVAPDTKPAKVYPKVSPLILGGLVKVFSTCRSCGLIMQVTDVRDTTHPLCPEKLTRMENWERNWVGIASIAPYDKLSPVMQRKLDELEFKMDTESDENQATALANAAMQYAEWGFKVFPLARNAKEPAIPRAHRRDDPLRRCKGECGKPGHGFHDATNDVERICRWWSRHPDHNIGLATGHLFDVIDIDPGAGGAESITQLLRDNRIPLVHGIVATAGSEKTKTKLFRPSGMHLYVKATDKGCYIGLRPGVDYKARGGYIVAPPSTLGSRVRSWSWATAPSPEIKA